MPTLEFEGKTYEVDEEGYLQDWQLWNERLAEHMAKLEGIELTEPHWEIIRFLRNYFIQYQIAPMIKILVKEIAKTMGPEKGNTKYLYELYPGGPAKQACKFAGLPKPTGCV